MIRTIVFDIGNVLFGYDPMHVLGSILPNNPYHNEYLTHFINAQVWQDLDRGSVDESTLSDQLSNKIPDPDLKNNLQLILDNFIHHMTLFEDNRKLFLTLKATYPIYLLSNFQAVPFSNLRELHPFLYQADGVIVSAHHQLMKPEPEIYQLLLNRFHLTPNETVFIDDLTENIDAAKKEGLHGIVFKSPDQLKKDLTSLGVVIE